MIRILLAAYRDFEDRVDMVSEKLPSLKIVRKSSLENALKRLIEEGVLVKHGSGRAVYYTRSAAE